MGKLIYGMIQSLDAYTEDEHGKFGWGVPDEEVHSCINPLASSVGTCTVWNRKRTPRNCGR